MTNNLESQRTRKPIRYTEEILGRKKGLSGHGADCYIDLGIESYGTLMTQNRGGPMRCGQDRTKPSKMTEQVNFAIREQKQKQCGG